LFWWIILPVIVIGIWAVFGAEQQSRIDAQYSIAGRPDPLKVEVSETKYTHAEYFIGSIKFIALMAILITGWRIEKQLVHLNNNVKSLQLNSVSTSRREN